MAKDVSATTQKPIPSERPRGEKTSKAKTRKCTFMISELNDIRLSAYARKKGIDRSKVVDNALSALFHNMRIRFPDDQESENEAAA